MACFKVVDNLYGTMELLIKETLIKINSLVTVFFHGLMEAITKEQLKMVIEMGTDNSNVLKKNIHTQGLGARGKNLVEEN